MRVLGDHVRLSATDLANHLGCRHLTELDLAAAEGRLQPPVWEDPTIDLLQLRGLEHERTYLNHLQAQGLTIVRLDEPDTAVSSVERTLTAMREGVGAIVQATLTSGRWHGRADVLLRVDRPSALGDWSYEVVDTKLARETRAGTILQLCLYSDIVGELQELVPERMHVVSPGVDFEPETFRTQDFLAYYRLVKERLRAHVDNGGDPTGVSYPEPVAQCELCRWWSRCDQTWRNDDHLSLVAGIVVLQDISYSERSRPPVAGPGSGLPSSDAAVRSCSTP